MSKTKLIILVVSILLLTSAGAIWPQVFAKMWNVVQSGDVNALVAIIRTYGYYAVGVSVAIGIVLNSTSVLPTVVISTANGLIYGLLPGIFITWFAECVGVSISFLLLRYVFRERALAMLKNSKFVRKLQRESNAHGQRMALFARAIPFVPAGLCTAFCAMSAMSFAEHTIGTFIGKIPAVAIEVIVGHDLVQFREHALRLTVMVGAIAAALIMYHLYNRRKRK